MSEESLKTLLRRAVADYMASEGCGCCADVEKHEQDMNRLGELLDVPMYDDRSGYNFSQFKTPKEDKSVYWDSTVRKWRKSSDNTLVDKEPL